MKNQLIAHNGSVQVELRQNKHICFISLRQRLIFYKQFLICQQNIQEIPDDLKQLYKTVWEISQKTVLKMAADRGAYIDQSQSLNIHIAEPNYGKLTSMHFYGWKLVRWGCAGGGYSCLHDIEGERVILLLICSSRAGPENRDVLPQDETSRSSHSVHPEQGEAEGGPVGQA